MNVAYSDCFVTVNLLDLTEQVWSAARGGRPPFYRRDQHRALLPDGGDTATGQFFRHRQIRDSSSQSEQTSHQATGHRYVQQVTPTE